MKPQNILVFRDQGVHSVKVIDFGFATRFLNQDDKFSLPRSKPWAPPENYSSRCKFNKSQAKKADIFSFGMLCAWILLNDYLTKRTSIPEEASWATSYIICDDVDSIEVIGSLKDDNKLSLFFQQVIGVEASLSEQERCSFSEFIGSALHVDPTFRHDDLEKIFPRLARHLYD
jgi:serine/threonine protein kinase